MAMAMVLMGPLSSAQCAVVPMRAEALAALAAQTLPEPAEVAKSGPFVPPPEARASLRAILASLRRAGGCAENATFMLSCPKHGRRVGNGLAAAMEAVRRAEVLVDRPTFCNRTFAHMSTPLKNTPGALLQQAETVHALMRGMARRLPPGEPPHLFALSLNAFYTGPSFLEILFGYGAAQSCADEVERFCGVDFGDSRTYSAKRLARLPPGERVAAPAGRAPPYRLLLDTVGNRRLPREDELACHEADRLRQLYSTARRVMPLASPFLRRPGRIVVAVHVRGGSGSKSPPEVAYFPVLDWLTSAAARRQRSLDVHVYHELDTGGRCCPLFAARASEGKAAQRRGASGASSARVHVHLNPNRYTMWQAMWEADVLITGVTKFSHLIGQLSPHIAVVIDGDRARGCQSPQSRRINWSPCREWREAGSFAHHEKKNCTPVVGLDTQRLDGALARLTDAAAKPYDG